MQSISKSKIIELEEIPEGWRIDKLGNLVSILVGYPFTSQEYSTSGVRLVRGDNVTEGKLRWGERTKYWSKVTPQLEKYLLRKGDFLIGMDGSKVGRNYAPVREEDLSCLLVQRVACLRVNKQLIQNYLVYVIGDKEFIDYVESTKTNAAIPHISSRQISEYKTLVPPIKEQQKIASILSKVDYLIQKTDQVIEQIRRLKKGLMQRLFGKRTRYSSNTPIIRQHQKFDGGEFEMEYKMFTIDEIKASSPNAITMGPFGSNITVDNFVTSGVPVIRGVNLTEEPFNLQGFVFLTEDKADELKSANAFPGDIIFTHRGTLGQVGIVPDNTKYKRYVVSQSQMKLTCNRNNAEPLYVYYFFRSSQGQRALLSNISGTGVPAIGQPTTSLRRIVIPLPRLQEQRRIAKIFSTENEFVQKQYEERSKLETLKKGLMQQLLTGKIRIKI
jgi:restriction endonuclease S subunit